MRKRILIVEDERMLARLVQTLLEQAGFEVAANVTSSSAAIAVLKADERVDGALLDINVDDGEVYPVARRLADRGVPFGFCTSVAPTEINDRFSAAPVLRKPVEADQLVEFVEELCVTEG